jgi:uncharacterized membrane protein
MAAQLSPHRLSSQTFEWLQRESSRWVSDGIVDDVSRARILSGYDTEPARHRGTMALASIAVLMCGIGVLLVIGYNWDRILPAVKVAIILTAVAAAFGGAAAAYARNRRMLGEVLAFSGTLLFGNGIWLIAQALHIQGHFPDAFLWFSAGAFATAFLVESTAIGIGAALLAGIWLGAEGSFYAHPIYPFLVLWPVAVWIAYRLRSTVIVRMLGIVAALWVLIATVNESHMVAWPGPVALIACALYAAGRWHDDESEMGDAWRTSGLAVLLPVMIPLMVGGMHREIRAEAPISTIIITVVAAAAAFSALGRPVRIPADWAVLLTAGAAAAWTGIVWSGLFTRGWWLTTGSTVLFSALALLLCVTLIRSAFRSNRTGELAFGVLFGLGFLLVRWTSVIENLLWSGLLLLVTGGGLLFVANLWLHRDRTVLMERAS